MKKEYTLLVLGIWVMIFPYLGFPYLWRVWILGVTGLCICLVAWRFWKDKKGPREPITESLPKIVNETQISEPTPTMADMPVSSPSPFIEHLKTKEEKVTVGHTHTVHHDQAEHSEITKVRAVRKPRAKLMGNDIA